MFVTPRAAEILALHESGLSQAEIARRLGITRPTVSYHLRRAGIPADPRFNRRYDWAAIQEYYDAGHTVTQCQERFGFARGVWTNALRRGDVVGRRHGMPMDELLSGTNRSRGHLKLRLFGAGLKEPRCETCGIAEWRGRPLSLALHHVNGDGSDNRLENLQILCPNCHSQTENFAGRNVRRRDQAQEPGLF